MLVLVIFKYDLFYCSKKFLIKSYQCFSINYFHQYLIRFQLFLSIIFFFNIKLINLEINNIKILKYFIQ